MGRISNSQLSQLNEIARSAYGSGWINEGKKGGEGYMGVLTDSSGKMRSVKFLTHIGERMTYNDSALSPDDRTRIQTASDNLRNKLAEIARAAGKSEKEIEQLLASEKGALTVGGKPLLSRKIVARAITAITEGVVDKDDRPAFSWKAIEHDPADTVDHTKMEDVLRTQLRPIGLLKADYTESELQANKDKYSFHDAKNCCQPRLNKLFEELKETCRNQDVRYAICMAMNKISPSIDHGSGELLAKRLKEIRGVVEEEGPWTAKDIIDSVKEKLQPVPVRTSRVPRLEDPQPRIKAFNAELAVLLKVVELVEAMYGGRDTLKTVDKAKVDDFFAQGENEALLRSEDARHRAART